MSKIAINRKKVIQEARLFGLVLEYDSKEKSSYKREKNFIRFRHRLAPAYEKRFAVVVWTTVNMADPVDNHIGQFQKALLDIGRWQKEQEITTVLGLQPKKDMD